MKRNTLFTLTAMAIMLSPDAAEGNTPAAAPVVEESPFKKDVNVTWIDSESNEELFGTIQSVENGIATIKDEDSKEIKIPIDDLEVAGEFKVIAEIETVSYTEKRYRKGKKGKEAALQGYSFAVPRYDSVDQLRAHLNAQLKKQNKHKEQDDKNGVTADDLILDNYHSMVDGKLRTRVKNEALAEIEKVGAPKFVEAHTDKLLFNAEQAHAWIPGIREVSGMSKLKVLANKLQEIKNANKGQLDMTNPDVLKLVTEIAMLAANK